jgi:ferrous iron transport protein B
MAFPDQIHRDTQTTTIALAGNPNTGKTTLFNALTGFRQRVGHYPGVTVDKKTGLLRSEDKEARFTVLDLPGAYSLAATSSDEGIVLDALAGLGEADTHASVIVCVVDAANLQRNLFLTSQLLELGRPVVVALNMVDVARAAGLEIDAPQLSRLLGVPVVEVVASKGQGIEALTKAIVTSLDSEAPRPQIELPAAVIEELEGLAASVAGEHCGFGPTTRAVLLQTLLNPGGYHEARLVRSCGLPIKQELHQRRERIRRADEDIAQVEAQARYTWIEQITRQVVHRRAENNRSRTDLADRFLTQPAIGMIVFIILMGAVFQSIFAWAAPLMDFIDGGFAALGGWLAGFLPEGALRSLTSQGVVAGVGAVLVFLPQILILFLFLAILEDCGYMARAAFLIDRYMRRIGLSGKCFIPLLCSFACAVPGIMATRTIEHPRHRLVTILIAPLMSCSARLPVYVLLIAAFVPATPLFGGLVGLQAMTLLGMYLVGVAVAIPVALIAKRILYGRSEPELGFLLELPSYKWPTPRTVLYRMYEQGREFLLRAGTIIFAVTVVVWALGYYPRPPSIAAEHERMRLEATRRHEQAVLVIARGFAPSFDGASLRSDADVAHAYAQLKSVWSAFDEGAEEEHLSEGTPAWRALRHEVEQRIASIVAQAGAAGEAAVGLSQADRRLAAALDEIERKEAGRYLRQSVLGRMGRSIEPVVRPLGWDWKIGTAVIAAFPAREVVIASLGTIYNLGEDQDKISGSLRSTLQRSKWPDGTPVFNLAVALSIMVFFALCCQCGATLATIKRETRSWRWPLITFTYMTVLAYLAALLTYQVAVRLV